MIERLHLQILREIDREGTLTKAASRLYLSQSALSHSIKKLEDQLGGKLWHKEGRQLVLTPAGRAALALAQRILPQFEQVEQQVAQMAQGQMGQLRIGMECHPCYQWLLSIVSDFLAAYPQVDLDVRQAFQFGGMAALASHEIDMLVTPDPITKPGFIFTPVFDYELSVVVHNDNPLAQQAYIEPQDLNAQTLYTYPVSIERLDIFNQFLLPHNIYPKQHKTLETTEILMQMVACGRGITALPKWLAEQLGHQLPISCVRAGKQGIQKQVFLGVREADAKVRYLQDFITLAKQGKGSSIAG